MLLNFRFNYFFCFICCLGMLSFSGCRFLRKSALSSSKKNFSKTAEYEARLCDVPLPLYASDIAVFDHISESKTRGQRFSMHVRMPTDEIVQFYNSLMELDGWDQKFFYKDISYVLLCFDKPMRTCMVTIKKINNQKSIVDICIIMK